MFNYPKRPWPAVLFVFNGVAYRWHGWFGCQLVSYEWRRPPAGTTRELVFNPLTSTTMYVFRTQRVGLKIRVTWSVSKFGGMTVLGTRVRKLRAELQRLV